MNHHILYRLEILLFYIFYYGQVTILSYPVYRRSIVKISFNAEDITYLEQELKNKFSIPEPESSISGWLSRILFLLHHGQVTILSYPMLSWVTIYPLPNREPADASV